MVMRRSGSMRKQPGALQHESFAPEMLHDLRPVTKSAVVLLNGIACAAGKVAPPEAKFCGRFQAGPAMSATRCRPAAPGAAIFDASASPKNARPYSNSLTGPLMAFQA
jgi:hypothetical protein